MSRVPIVKTAPLSRQELNILASQCGDLERPGFLGPAPRCFSAAWWPRPPHPLLLRAVNSGRIFRANYRAHRAAAIISIN